MNNIFMFYFLAAMIIVFSILTVTSRKVLRAATYLLFVLISTAAVYFLLEHTFLAAVQLTVYAGGIVVLIIFSILLTSRISEKTSVAGAKQQILSALAAGAGAILTLITIVQYGFPQESVAAPATSVAEVGLALTSYKRDGFALPFEVISILLLASMIGAIVVARKENTKEEELKNKEL